MDLQALWDKAQTENFNALNANEDRKFEPVPTGTYQASLTNATLSAERTPPQVSLWYTLTEGEYANRKVFANFSLNEVGLAILKKELAKLGYTATPKSLDDLAEQLTKLVGAEVEVYAKHRTYQKKDGTLGDAHNVYINTTASLDAVATSAPSVDASDKLPF